MDKKIILGVSVSLLFGIGSVSLLYFFYGQKSPIITQNTPPSQTIKGEPSVSKNAIDIGVLNGVDIKIPLFDSVIIPLKNGDMTFDFDDKSFIIKQTSPIISGTGMVLLPIQVSQNEGQSYHFITAFVQNENTWKQKQSVFLGNTITINTFSYENDILMTDFTIPSPKSTGNEPQTESVKKYFVIEKGNISPFYPNINNGLIKDMNIIAGVWLWKETILGNGEKILPKKPGIFGLKMNEEGEFSATTDCNSMIGKFVMDEKNVSYSDIALTKMACDDMSQQDLFVSYLNEVKKYDFTPEKQFVFFLSDNSKVIFEMMKK